MTVAQRMWFWVVVLAAVTGASPARPEPAEAPPRPDPHRLLFWTPAEQRFGYRTTERVLPTRPVTRGPASAPLARSDAVWTVEFDLEGRRIDADALMRDENVAGLLVIHHGRVVLERHGLGATVDGRWTSFSVARSITSTLVGAAIRDGSVDDPVTRCLPGLAGSAYEA